MAKAKRELTWWDTLGQTTALATSSAQVGAGVMLTVYSGGLFAIAGGALISSGVQSGINAAKSTYNGEAVDLWEYGKQTVIGGTTGVVAGGLGTAAAGLAASSSLISWGTNAAIGTVGVVAHGAADAVVNQDSKRFTKVLTPGQLVSGAVGGALAAGASKGAADWMGSVGKDAVKKVLSEASDDVLTVVAGGVAGAAGGATGAGVSTVSGNIIKKSFETGQLDISTATDNLVDAMVVAAVSGSASGAARAAKTVQQKREADEAKRKTDDAARRIAEEEQARKLQEELDRLSLEEKAAQERDDKLQAESEQKTQLADAAAEEAATAAKAAAEKAQLEKETTQKLSEVEAAAKAAEAKEQEAIRKANDVAAQQKKLEQAKADAEAAAKAKEREATKARNQARNKERAEAAAKSRAETALREKSEAEQRERNTQQAKAATEQALQQERQQQAELAKQVEMKQVERNDAQQALNNVQAEIAKFEAEIKRAAQMKLTIPKPNKTLQRIGGNALKEVLRTADRITGEANKIIEDSTKVLANLAQKSQTEAARLGNLEAEIQEAGRKLQGLSIGTLEQQAEQLKTQANQARNQLEAASKAQMEAAAKAAAKATAKANAETNAKNLAKAADQALKSAQAKAKGVQNTKRAVDAATKDLQAAAAQAKEAIANKLQIEQAAEALKSAASEALSSAAEKAQVAELAKASAEATQKAQSELANAGKAVRDLSKASTAQAVDNLAQEIKKGGEKLASAPKQTQETIDKALQRAGKAAATSSLNKLAQDATKAANDTDKAARKVRRYAKNPENSVREGAKHMANQITANAATLLEQRQQFQGLLADAGQNIVRSLHALGITPNGELISPQLINGLLRDFNLDPTSLDKHLGMLMKGGTLRPQIQVGSTINNVGDQIQEAWKKLPPEAKVAIVAMAYATMPYGVGHVLLYDTVSLTIEMKLMYQGHTIKTHAWKIGTGELNHKIVIPVGAGGGSGEDQERRNAEATNKIDREQRAREFERDQQPAPTQTEPTQTGEEQPAEALPSDDTVVEDSNTPLQSTATKPAASVAPSTKPSPAKPKQDPQERSQGFEDAKTYEVASKQEIHNAGMGNPPQPETKAPTTHSTSNQPAAEAAGGFANSSDAKLVKDILVDHFASDKAKAVIALAKDPTLEGVVNAAVDFAKSKFQDMATEAIIQRAAALVGSWVLGIAEGPYALAFKMLLESNTTGPERDLIKEAELRDMLKDMDWMPLMTVLNELAANNQQSWVERTATPPPTISQGPSK
jgi:hypothetical protein